MHCGEDSEQLNVVGKPLPQLAYQRNTDDCSHLLWDVRTVSKRTLINRLIVP